MADNHLQARIASDNGAAPYCGFLQSFNVCFFRKYFDFRGRASRSEFFYFYLAQVVIGFTVGIPCELIFPGSSYFVEFILQMLFLSPFLAVGVRRMHDIGSSGVLWIITYILSQLMVVTSRYDYMYEFVGPDLHLLIVALGIVVLVFCLIDLAKKGEAGSNQYG